MKKVIALLQLIALAGFGAEAVKQTQTPNKLPSVWLADATLEPYGTVSWQGLDGKARYGAGANVATHLTKNISLWGFGESDNTEHSVVDRGGIGLRYEAAFGKRIHGDAGIAYAYNFEDNFSFIRLPLGLTADVLQSKYVSLGLRAAYAFDISGNGKHGAADGRAFLGPVATLKW